MSTEATTPKPKKRDRIGVILYLLYVLLLIASLVLILRLAGIQLFWKPDPKIADALTPSNTVSVIEPARGNILDAEGRLLAISQGHQHPRAGAGLARQGPAARRRAGRGVRRQDGGPVLQAHQGQPRRRQEIRPHRPAGEPQRL